MIALASQRARSAWDLVTLRPDALVITGLRHLTDANKRRLDAFLQKVDTTGTQSVFAFDLSQDAAKRFRMATATHMVTLTKGCNLWYVPDLQRCLCLSDYIMIYELVIVRVLSSKSYTTVMTYVYQCSTGGGELLMAHGFPTASWAASRLGIPPYHIGGLSNLVLS